MPDYPNEDSAAALSNSGVLFFYSVVLTSESVDKILWCDHSNGTSLAVLSHDTIYFQQFYKMKFPFFRILTLATRVTACVFFLYQLRNRLFTKYKIDSIKKCTLQV